MEHGQEGPGGGILGTAERISARKSFFAFIFRKLEASRLTRARLVLRLLAIFIIPAYRPTARGFLLFIAVQSSNMGYGRFYQSFTAFLMPH
jgi:hypothetical protein